MQDKFSCKLGKSEAEDLWRVSLSGGNRVLLSTEDREELVALKNVRFLDLTAPAQQAANAPNVRLNGTMDAAATARPADE